MTDIAVVNANDVVIGDGASIANGKVIANGSVIARFTPADVTIVTSVAALPGDFANGKYLWQGDAYVLNPTYTEPAGADVWSDAQPRKPDDVPGVLAAALGPVKYNAVRTSPKTSWIWDIIFAPSMTAVNPNDKDGRFRGAIAYLQGAVPWGGEQLSSPDDDAIILSPTEVGDCATEWKKGQE